MRSTPRSPNSRDSWHERSAEPAPITQSVAVALIGPSALDRHVGVRLVESCAEWFRFSSKLNRPASAGNAEIAMASSRTELRMVDGVPSCQ